METLAILVAAGRGERMGAPRPKALLTVAGQTLLERSAVALDRAPSIAGLIVVVPKESLAEASEILTGLGLRLRLTKRREVIAGGARRQDSVWQGLNRVPMEFDGVVLVHDAARPLVEPELIERVVRAAHEHGAAVPVLPVTDTIKRMRDGRICETVDRSELGAAQTPQGFRYTLLRRAYEQAARDGVELTDEAMALERLGEAVHVVAGSPRNRKITHADDLAWAEDLLRRTAGPETGKDA